jgi:hypothetical protein
MIPLFSCRHLLVLATALVTGALLVGSVRAERSVQAETIYAVATTAQFMDHADDRLRGMSTNPFNLKAATVILNANGKEKLKGPFPGDDVLYSFKLYADPKLAKQSGTAMFTCYYDFQKRATCDSYLELPKGLVLASGQIVFDGTRFTLSVTGGTKQYLGVLGEIRATPVANNAERLDLRLLRSAG